MLRRHFQCDGCGFAFTMLCEKNDPHPDCPECAGASQPDPAAERAADDARLARMIESGRPPGVLTVKSKAVRYMQEIAEQDFGLTDIRTGAVGENAMPAPSSPHTAEAQAIVREMIDAGAPEQLAAQCEQSVKNFFGANAPGAKPPTGTPSVPNPFAEKVKAHAATAPAAAAQARSEGVDPIGILHAAGKAGKLGRFTRPIGYCPLNAA